MSIVINFNANGTTFNFNIQKDFTKIESLSGVGKTFFCNSLKSALNTWKDTDIYPVKDAITNENIKTKVLSGIDEFSCDILKDENTLYIIDDANMYLMDHLESVDVILENKTSKFIFMLRANVDNLPFNYDEKAYITRDKATNTIDIQYYN